MNEREVDKERQRDRYIQKNSPPNWRYKTSRFREGKGDKYEGHFKDFGNTLLCHLDQNACLNWRFYLKDYFITY